jgi:hypothetical protein
MSKENRWKVGFTLPAQRRYGRGQLPERRSHIFAKKLDCLVCSTVLGGSQNTMQTKNCLPVVFTPGKTEHINLI